MSKITRRFLMIATMAVMFASVASTAGAAAWHNTGAAAFHATGGGLSLGITNSGGTNLFTCTGSTMTGTSPVGSFANVYIMSETLDYAPCSISGTPYNVHCDSAFTGLSYTAGTPAVSTGITSMTCVLSASGVPLCHIGGTVPTHYVNPNAPAPGRFTLTPSTLTVSHASGQTCAIFIGTFASATAHVGEQTITLTGGGPVLTRTV